jgi:hypothetical protein
MKKTKIRLQIIGYLLCYYLFKCFTKNFHWIAPLFCASFLSLSIFANERRVNIQSVLYEPKVNLIKCMISIEGRALEALDDGKEVKSGCYVEFESNFIALQNMFYLLGEKLEKMSDVSDDIDGCDDDDSLNECAKIAQSGMYSCRNYFLASNVNPHLKSLIPYHKSNGDVLKEFYNRFRRKRDECLSLNDSIEKRILKARFWYIF